MIPERIGRYIVISELGRGGMATVYLARDPNFERDVAIKILPEIFLHDSQFRTRFEREAKTIAMLEHPAIVPVYDFGESSGQPFIVMRYMSGGTLADRIERGPLSIEEVSRLVTRLAPALDAAHSQGIIHRDLKPGNILFDHYGNAFLSDFGIAHLAAEGLTTLTGGMALGTPAYMSPEQIQGDKKIDRRSDIYSLGVMLYEMLTGQMPFRSDTPAQLMMMHILQPAPRILDTRSDLPPACNFILSKALSKNPADRYSTIGEIAAAFQMVTFNPQVIMEVDNNSGANPTAVAASIATIASVKPQELNPAPNYSNIPINPSSASDIPMQKHHRTNRGLPSWLIVVILVVLLGAAGIGYLGYQGFGPLSMLAPNDVETPTTNENSGVASQATIQPTSTFSDSDNIAESISTQPTTIQVLITSTLQAILVSATPTIDTAQSIQPSVISEVLPTPALPPLPANTPTPQPTSEPAPTINAAGPTIGGADKLAFIMNKEVFISNLDGSQLTQITRDQSDKSNLQWSPDGNLVHYISGKCINGVDILTLDIQQVVCFNSADSVSAFQISPDGQQVIISIDNQMYVVVYDLDNLSEITSRNQLKSLAACADWAPYTRNLVKDARWSLDGKTLALLLIANLGNGIRGDAIQLIDLSYCVPNPHIIDNFPRPRFEMENYDENPTIQTFGYDGKSIFALNNFVRNDGFGDLYIYNSELYKAYPDINPIEGKCCYRDAAFSPDGSYLVFAFQDYSQGVNSQTVLYMLPFGQISSEAAFEPLNLPAITDPREHPSPVLRPAR